MHETMVLDGTIERDKKWNFNYRIGLFHLFTSSHLGTDGILTGEEKLKGKKKWMWREWL